MDKEAKKKLFDELYPLDVDESDEEELSTASEFLKSSKAIVHESKCQTDRIGDKDVARPSQPLSRTVSAPLPQRESTLLRPARLTGDMSPACPISANAVQHYTKTVPLVLTEVSDVQTLQAMAKTRGKRKRGQSLETKPESQQIFRGHSFCSL